MRSTLRSAPVVFSILALVFLLTGCPKRPATSGLAAPAPAEPRQASVVQSAPVPAAAGTPSGPPAAAPQPGEFAATSHLKDIHFDFDKYAIRPQDAKILDANASWLKTNARNLILIEGHCDERGTNEYNLALGERRAKATMGYLVAQGVQATRVTLISYGKERPVCTEHNEACWAQNRRAHFLTKER